MHIKHNYLRWHRRKSHLTQEDLIFILGVKDKSQVSRWEKGERKPDIYTLLSYHLLFGIPIEEMFGRQKNTLTESISKKIAERISFLKENGPDGIGLKRIAFLGDALSRLSPNFSEGA